MTYSIICNRAEAPLATCDDIENAGRIVGALLATRLHPEWFDYWAVDSDGNEYYYDEEYRTIFRYHPKKG